MALLTGECKYSDLAERTLFNAVLPGVALDGTTWLYANPLQVRDEHVDRHGDHGVRRTRWFRCACCPPNVMRLLASLPHYFASADADGLQLHQYATGVYAAESGGDTFAVRVQTDYPWHGTVAVTCRERAGRRADPVAADPRLVRGLRRPAERRGARGRRGPGDRWRCDR